MSKQICGGVAKGLPGILKQGLRSQAHVAVSKSRIPQLE